MEEVKTWLDGERDYAVGVEIFARHTKNKVLAATFLRGGERFHADKLAYEMGKLLRGKATFTARPSGGVNAAAREKSVEIPQEVLAAKKEIAALYNKISIMHDELYECGTSNDEATVKKRKRILDKRKPLIDRADKLYQLKEDYFNTKGATRRAVLEELRELQSLSVCKQVSITKPEPAHAVCKLDDVEIMKRRQSLRSSISKTNNMLLYQSIRKGETPAPMPDGPKRAQFEEKLAALQEEYNAVVTEINRRTKR